MNLRVASFFAGIGGFDRGFEEAGMEVVFQSEIHPFRRKVLKKNWPDVPLEGDINKIVPSTIPKADVWCGGFPCQDLSLANQGKRKGLQGERSGLFFKFHELLQYHMPSWVVLENVPGLLNSHEGRDFQVLVQKMDELGYGLSWRILDAKYFGTPQRRRRVYIIGSLGNLCSADVLFEREGITIAKRSGLGEREEASGRHGNSLSQTDVYSIQHASINRKPEAGPQAKGYRNDGETYTLDSRGSSDAVCSTNVAFGVRNSSGLSEKLDSNRLRAVGDAVAVPVSRWIGQRIVATSNMNNFPFTKD